MIEAIVRQAIDRAPALRPLGLFTVADKKGEAGLTEAAGRLALDLVFLTREALREKAPFIHGRSTYTERLFGVPAVAEAAALAGAGPDSVLIVSRIANAGATCAVASSRTGRS